MFSYKHRDAFTTSWPSQDNDISQQLFRACYHWENRTLPASWEQFAAALKSVVYITNAPSAGQYCIWQEGTMPLAFYVSSCMYATHVSYLWSTTHDNCDISMLRANCTMWEPAYLLLCWQMYTFVKSEFYATLRMLSFKQRCKYFFFYSILGWQYWK